MRIILLSQHRYATIDDGYYDDISKFNWYAKTIYNTTYACRMEGRKTVYMHHVIIKPNPGEVIDHRDQQGLNNCSSNLRSVSVRHNLINCKRRVPKTSKYRGVYKPKDRDGWTAMICSHGKKYNLGTYSTENTAAEKYNEAATRLFGEFAVLNKISGRKIKENK